MNPRYQFFAGYKAWRTAFWSLMALEQGEELQMSVAESCLPDQCRYVSKKEVDASKAGMDMVPRKGFSQARKKRYNTKAPRAAEPAKN